MSRIHRAVKNFIQTMFPICIQGSTSYIVSTPVLKILFLSTLDLPIFIYALTGENPNKLAAMLCEALQLHHELSVHSAKLVISDCGYIYDQN